MVRMNVRLNIEDLLKQYGTDILRLIRFYTKSDNDAEDLTQEVFIRAHKTLSDFRNECSPKTWLIRIAVNVCRNYHRSQLRHPQVLVDTIPFAGRSPSAESEVMEHSESTDLVRLIQELPIQQKEVILLHYYEEESVASIATLLGVSVSTVKIRLFRARKALKRRKEELHDAEGSEYSSIFATVKANG
jgi:RNA polymerase sigma factor (sigma-70 family)